MRIADHSVTRAILERHGFTFKKSFGQNFLTDTNILQKIVDTAEIDKNVNVIEIGPGIGALTEFLAENAAEVMAFEIDDRLVPILADTLRDFDNVTVVNQDILKVDLAQYIAEFKNPDLPIKVVANLPYYITTPILLALLEQHLPITHIVTMVQKEVAERMIAAPGSKIYGTLSVAVQYHTEPRIVREVAPRSFIPAPEVASAVIACRRREKPPVDVTDERMFFRVARASFGQRRKTLANALLGTGASKEIVRLALDAAAIDAKRRGETLSLAEFARLADAFSAMQTEGER